MKQRRRMRQGSKRVRALDAAPALQQYEERGILTPSPTPSRLMRDLAARRAAQPQKADGLEAADSGTHRADEAEAPCGSAP